MRGSHGMTLIETLTTLALLSVLCLLAAPGFGALRQDSLRTAALNDLYHALYLARSESLKRGEVVSVCKTQDQQTCARSDVQWTSGWLVFENTDRDDPPVRDPNEPIIAVYAGWKHGSVTSTRVAFSFRPHTQGVVNGTIVFCDRRGAAHARAIIVSHSGRPRIASRGSGNQPLRCPD